VFFSCPHLPSVAASQKATAKSQDDDDISGLFGGIISDFKHRFPYYKRDWTDHASFNLLAPATYVFLASVIPAITFGESIYDSTEGQFGGTQILLSTSICGIMQSFLGGQPMLIVGVAGPVIIMYAFMFEFCQDYEIPYRQFCACTCYWAAGMIMLLAAINTTSYIHSFTRLSGETFGLLISVLFFQQGMKGLIAEYRVESYYGGDDTDLSDSNASANATDPLNDADLYVWRLFNGTWATFSAFGLLLTTLTLRETRNTNFFKGPIRKYVSEYSTFFMIVLWTLISFAPANLPEEIPRRIKIKYTWDASSQESWGIIEQMDLDKEYVGGAVDEDGDPLALTIRHVFLAFIPGFIIAVLFFFDHNVSSQCCQLKEFGLKKPHAYHWDFFLVGIMTLVCGLCGWLPSNGAIPQAPIHTKACAEFVRGPDGKKDKTKFQIREQRWTNLIQSLLCLLCLFITKALQQIPRSVLWGFFLYMAVDGMRGSQFSQRLCLFITDSKRLKNLVRGEHNTYLDNVKYSVVRNFTLLQLLAFTATFLVSLIKKYGAIFPLLIMAMVPLRKQYMPKWFKAADLLYLDPHEWDEVPSKGEGPAAGSIADEAIKNELAGPDETTALDEALRHAGIGDGEVRSRTVDHF
jgi:hypothetical protein